MQKRPRSNAKQLMSVRVIGILNRRRVDLGILLVFLSVLFANYALAEGRLQQTDNTHDKNYTSKHVNELSNDLSSDRLYTESMQVLGNPRTPIARWNGPIRLAVVGANDEFLEAKILPIFNEISLLIGLQYRVIRHNFVTADEYAQLLRTTPQYDFSLCDKTEPQYCANFIVIISERDSIHDIAISLPLRPVFQQATSTTEDTLCFFSPGITRDREIVRSLVYVPVDLEPAMKLTCLHEEIYQSFGLFGDHTDSYYFSFNNRVEPKVITRYDKWLLSSLYDRTISSTSFSAQVVQQLVNYFRDAVPLVK